MFILYVTCNKMVETGSQQHHIKNCSIWSYDKAKTADKSSLLLVITVMRQTFWLVIILGK